MKIPVFPSSHTPVTIIGVKGNVTSHSKSDFFFIPSVKSVFSRLRCFQQVSVSHRCWFAQIPLLNSHIESILVTLTCMSDGHCSFFCGLEAAAAVFYRHKWNTVPFSGLGAVHLAKGWLGRTPLTEIQVWCVHRLCCPGLIVSKELKRESHVR